LQRNPFFLRSTIFLQASGYNERIWRFFMLLTFVSQVLADFCEKQQIETCIFMNFPTFLMA